MNIVPMLDRLLPVDTLTGQAGSPVSLLHTLIAAGCDAVPLPAAGATLERWRCLARVAAYDLSLAKLYEGHTDALAIMAALDAPLVTPGSSWGMWAADPPQAGVTASPLDSSPIAPLAQVHLQGDKFWCSGAAGLSHGLLTVRDGAGRLFLAAVDLHAPGITMHTDAWQAVGMAGSASIDLHFEQVSATIVGTAGAYLERVGFWHGGAGVAACWYGGAAALGERVRRDFARTDDPHWTAHLGAIAVALEGARATLRSCAQQLDGDPLAPSVATVLQTRLQIEQVATDVMQHAARAVGAGPLCRDARFARLMADLPVYLRQSHAERDLASLGTRVLDHPLQCWSL